MLAMLHDRFYCGLHRVVALFPFPAICLLVFISRRLFYDRMGLRVFEILSNTSDDCFLFNIEKRCNTVKSRQALLISNFKSP